jgi:hypothetical protein
MPWSTCRSAISNDTRYWPSPLRYIPIHHPALESLAKNHGGEILDINKPSDLAVPVPNSSLFPIGAGLSRFILQAFVDKHASLPIGFLMWFTAEGDNMQDAHGLASALDTVLHLKGMYYSSYPFTNITPRI